MLPLPVHHTGECKGWAFLQTHTSKVITGKHATNDHKKSMTSQENTQERQLFLSQEGLNEGGFLKQHVLIPVCGILGLNSYLISKAQKLSSS